MLIGGLAAAAVLPVPQAFVTAARQLALLRFLKGLTLGGLLPCVTTIIRHSAPAGAAGKLLGYATSSQLVGQVAEPLLVGVVGGHLGMRLVFLGTAVLLMFVAIWVWRIKTAWRRGAA